MHVVLGIAEVRQPDFAILQARDHVRFADDDHLFLAQLGERLLNVLDEKVEDRARVVELRILRLVEHQPNAAAVEESEIAGAKQKFQAEAVAVEGDGAVRVVRAKRDLADALNLHTRIMHHAQRTLFEKRVLRYISSGADPRPTSTALPRQEPSREAKGGVPPDRYDEPSQSRPMPPGSFDARAERRRIVMPKQKDLKRIVRSRMQKTG